MTAREMQREGVAYKRILPLSQGKITRAFIVDGLPLAQTQDVHLSIVTPFIINNNVVLERAKMVMIKKSAISYMHIH